MSDIRHIVFDLGQVLIRWEPETPYLALIPDAAERARFFADICNQEWNAEQDRGRPWREAEDVLIAAHPAEADLIRAYRARWHAMVPGQLDANVAIVEDLIDAQHDVTALTNWAPDTYRETVERFPILSRFRGVTVSGDVHLIKPDPAIFRHHAETFGLEPSGILFFDDNRANVEAARALGWTAEQYVSTDALRSDLRRYGLMA